MKLGRFIIRVLGPLVRCVMRTRVVGAENIPQTPGDPPLILCCNHISNWDPVLLEVVQPRHVYFMAKAELFKVPVLGFLVRKLGAYPVSRGKNDVGAVKRTVKLLESGRTVGMFPQGTRCPLREPRDCKIKFGAGLITAHTGAKVLPVHIKMKNYKWKFFRRVDVIIGEPIPFEAFHYQQGVSGEYARITQQIYDEICRLGEESK